MNIQSKDDWSQLVTLAVTGPKPRDHSIFIAHVSGEAALFDKYPNLAARDTCENERSVRPSSVERDR